MGQGCWIANKMDCGIPPAGFVFAGCQGPWRFGRRTPPGLDRSNGSLTGLAADSLAALFFDALVFGEDLDIQCVGFLIRSVREGDQFAEIRVMFPYRRV
jgi:hypothetical protein